MVFGGVSENEYNRILGLNHELDLKILEMQRKTESLQNDLQKMAVKAAEVGPLKYQISELETQISSLNGSITGYREAVGRWRRRVEGCREQEISEPQLVSAKRRGLGEGWIFTQTYIIHNVEPDPAFHFEAWDAIKAIGWEKECREIFFHEKLQCWVAVLDKKW